MDVPVYNQKGKKVGTMSIDEASLGGVVNHALLKQAFVRYHANRRQGSARTKSRGMVQGSTRKLFRQKGTGRARVGSVRSGIRKGGGVIFAKNKPREAFRQDMPIKMRRLANRNALLAKLIDDEVKVFDDLTFKSPSTKAFEALIAACKIDRSALVALNPDNMNARLSARNVTAVTVCPSHQLTCYEMLNHRYLLITKSDLEAWLIGPSSRTTKEAKAQARSRVKEEASA